MQLVQSWRRSKTHLHAKSKIKILQVQIHEKTLRVQEHTAGKRGSERPVSPGVFFFSSFFLSNRTKWQHTLHRSMPACQLLVRVSCLPRVVEQRAAAGSWFTQPSVCVGCSQWPAKAVSLFWDQGPQRLTVTFEIKASKGCQSRLGSRPVTPVSLLWDQGQGWEGRGGGAGSLGCESAVSQQ